MSSSEIEELVVKLGEGGLPSSEIGIVLRDKHGVGSVKEATGKSVTQILTARGIKRELPEDLMALLRKAVALHRYLARNRRDEVSKRSLEIVERKVNSLVKYYVRNGKLPKDWRYDPERAAILVR